MPARIQLRRGSKAFWESENPILRIGEPGLELHPGEPTKLKIGDGETHWNELPYSPTTTSTPGEGEIPVDLEAHVNDPTPHPAYDDMPSLAILYQNAKV